MLKTLSRKWHTNGWWSQCPKASIQQASNKTLPPSLLLPMPKEMTPTWDNSMEITSELPLGGSFAHFKARTSVKKNRSYFLETYLIPLGWIGTVAESQPRLKNLKTKRLSKIPKKALKKENLRSRSICQHTSTYGRISNGCVCWVCLCVTQKDI